MRLAAVILALVVLLLPACRPVGKRQPTAWEQDQRVRHAKLQATLEQLRERYAVLAEAEKKP